MNCFNLYGLPRSGTNFLEQLVVQNFKVKISQDPNGYGKHYPTPDPDRKYEDLILVIYKSPYKWIESLIFHVDWFTINKDWFIKEKKIEDILKSNTNVVMKNVTERMLKNHLSRVSLKPGHTPFACWFPEKLYDSIKNKLIVLEENDLNNECLHKMDLIINQKYLALYWKKHFKNFNKLQNKEIIYYENLLSLENRMKFLDKIRQKYNFEPLNNEWNIEIFNVNASPHYNENEMNTYYQQKNVFKFLKTNHLRLINECFEDNWLSINTQYEMVYKISD